MAETRAAGFGAEVKRRIMLGTYALSSGYYDAYYGKAQQVRTLIIQDFEAAFSQVDVLVSPVTPTTAFRIGERADDPMAMYLADLCTIPSNLAGNAAISVPCGLADEDGLPVGLQVMAPPLADDRLYRVAAAVRRRSTALGTSAADRGEGADLVMTVTYEEALQGYEPVFGLETHVELGTTTKMFCGCLTAFGAEPNTHVCPICLGLPGSLPVVNRRSIEFAIKIGLALNCSIASWCRFARKNYFYPDMPKNFQISQYDEPLCTDGYLDVLVGGRRSGSASSGSTWRRTPASRCTWAGRPAASRGPSTRWSTTTGRASRWSRSSPSRCRAPATWRPRSPRPTSPSSATCSARSGSPTCGWRRARCGAT